MQQIIITINDDKYTATMNMRDSSGEIGVDIAISETGPAIGWRIRVGDVEETYAFDLCVDENPLSRIRQDVGTILEKWIAGKKILH